MARNKCLATLLSLILVATLAGCGGGDSGTKVLSGEVTVKMKNLNYDPKKLTIKKGTKLTFVNMDAMEHDVTQVDAKDLGKKEPGWKSDIIAPGKSWSITLDQPGVYPILCVQYGHFTAGMMGEITVVD